MYYDCSKIMLPQLHTKCIFHDFFGVSSISYRPTDLSLLKEFLKKISFEDFHNFIWTRLSRSSGSWTMSKNEFWICLFSFFRWSGRIHWGCEYASQCFNNSKLPKTPSEKPESATEKVILRYRPYITYITFRGDAGKEKMAIFTHF